MTIKNRKYPDFFNFKLLSNAVKYWSNNKLIARGMAFVTVLNLGVVFFDVTYIPMRDFWLLGKVTLAKFNIGPYSYEGLTLQVLPSSLREVITSYDIVKGILPYRDTNNYLKEVKKLEDSINENGLNSFKTTAILGNLREKSLDMINEDPFKLAKKTGTLERIKNLMRDHVYTENNSSKLAFSKFWSVKNLENKTQEELAFFNEQIKPLISTNYFRPYSETGGFVDYFGLIDFPFFVFISFDFLARTLYISFRHNGVNWLDAMLWRWYDLIFFLPIFRWLRIIPVTIRLDETQLINLKAIKKQSSQGFVASIAGDITEVVVLRIVDQIQNLINEGAIKKFVSSSENNQEYIDLNDTNEIAEITKLIINLIAYKVLPEIRSEVENLLNYTMEKAIVDSPAYQNIKHIPTLKDFPKNISAKVSHQLYQVVLDTIFNLLKEDPMFELYLQKIIEKFTKTVSSEMSAKQSLDKIEDLLDDFLEEVKVNYIQKLSEEDVEKLLEETRRLETKFQ